MLKSNRPEFLIIGVMKAGTTTLHYNLNQSKEISMSSIKEPNYLIPSENMTEEEYVNLFNEKFINGESSIVYFNNIETINIEQNQKIILILRDPIERAFSHYKMYLKYKDTGSFSDFYQEERYLRVGLYSKKLKFLFKKYNHKNILILGFEDFIENEEAITNRVLSFLSLNSINLKKEHKHKSYFFKSKIINYIYINIEKRLYFLKNLFKENTKLGTLMRKFYIKIKDKFNSDLKIESKDREKLKEFYKEDVKNVQKIMNENNFDYSFMKKWNNFKI